jgi:hypothetical protein
MLPEGEARVSTDQRECLAISLGYPPFICYLLLRLYPLFCAKLRA